MPRSGLSPASLRWNLNLLDMLSRLWNGFTVKAHTLDVEFNSLANELSRLFRRAAGSDATWKVGNVRAKAGSGRFKEHCVSVHFRPACFSIDVCVFGSKSSDG